MIDIASSSSRSLLALFPPGPELTELTEAIYRAVRQSFEETGGRHATRAEAKHRFELCVTWVKTLRGDLKWGKQRIFGALPGMLRSELSGQRYVPSDRLCWISEDGR